MFEGLLIGVSIISRQGEEAGPHLDDIAQTRNVAADGDLVGMIEIYSAIGRIDADDDIARYRAHVAAGAAVGTNHDGAFINRGAARLCEIARDVVSGASPETDMPCAGNIVADGAAAGICQLVIVDNGRDATITPLYAFDVEQRINAVRRTASQVPHLELVGGDLEHLVIVDGCRIDGGVGAGVTE
jgi:hypothetical protein